MYYLGIDLGGTNIAVGLVNETFEIVKKGSVPTLPQRESEEITKDMGALCCRLVEEAGLSWGEIVSVGIAAPGAVNPETGVISYSCNLPFVNYGLTEALKRYCPAKNVYLENDANAAALGEAMSGAAKGAPIAMMITLGTGVGGGVVFNGKIYSGFNYAGAELGHMVIEVDGRPCSCGRKGCWEAYSSATGLVNLTKDKLANCSDTIMWDMCQGDPERASARHAFEAMRQGDAAGKEVVDDYIKYLACGITNMINIFQPNVLCIGGGVCNEGDYLLKPLIELVEREQYTRDQAIKTKICIAKLGNDAGIIGAAALGI
ncbi:MAG: ROK family protein [Ruminococcaceae bacterium]|nr:ROK family protein [Oscillospiraceae bacterium]